MAAKMKYASMLVDAKRIADEVWTPCESRKIDGYLCREPTKSEIRSHICWLFEHFPPESADHAQVVEALTKIRTFVVCAGIMSTHDTEINDYIDIKEPLPIDA